MKIINPLGVAVYDSGFVEDNHLAYSLLAHLHTHQAGLKNPSNLETNIDTFRLACEADKRMQENNPFVQCDRVGVT